MVVSLRLNTDNADRLRYFQKKKEQVGIEPRTNIVLDYKLGTLPTTLASRWQSSIKIGSVPNPNPNLILPTLNDTAYGVGKKNFASS